MIEIIVIAHSEQMGTPELHVFYSNDEAVEHLADIVSGEYDIPPTLNQDFREYIARYYEWSREENDNMCEVTIDYEVITIKTGR